MNTIHRKTVGDLSFIGEAIKIIIIMVTSFFFFSLNVDGNMIYILDEAKNAECAREMFEQGDVIVPTFNYELRTDKPPLHYFFMMLAYQLFGVNELSARIFSAFFGMLTVLVTFLFTKKYFGERSAWLACLVLLSSLHFLLEFHLAVPDPFLIFFITATLLSFLSFFQDKDPRFLFPFYISMALGVLAKGPIAILLPGLIIFLFLIFVKKMKWSFIVRLKPFLGALLVGAIVLPWYVAVHIKTDGAWTEGFFLEHNVQRFTETKEGHGGSFFLAPVFVLIGLLPFSIFVFQSFRYAWSHKQNKGLVFCLLAVSVITLFFAVSQTRLPNYTMPAYPFLAILIGTYLADIRKRSLKHLRASLWVYLLLMLLLPLAIFFGLRSEPDMMHLWYLSLYFLVLPIGAMLALYFGYKRKPGSIITSLAVSFILMSFLFFTKIFPQVDRQNPVFSSLHLIDNSKPVVHYKRINPAYLFYLKRPIKKFNNLNELETFLAHNKEAYVISRARYIDELNDINEFKLLFKKKDLFESSTTVLLSTE
ncbi:glycosyltransferase family 39 protein [Fulvivirgaceae bacterium BMA10]|uniref:Glycosyltransferase family 39 protein n=1 Tax=Splendidivirga corallicola TaxID=3051826 RepID=A0ABT8KYD5_9BACT|nr:glycosyltransferase family 39 protein [Fulvivirgaceae bacterium BMA10]